MTRRHARLYRRQVVVVRGRRDPLTGSVMWMASMCWLMVLVCWMALKWTALAVYWTARWTWKMMQPLLTRWSMSRTRLSQQQESQQEQTAEPLEEGAPPVTVSA